MANPKPTIVFSLNLKNPEVSSLPYRSLVAGNESVSEATSQVNARSSWLSSLTGMHGEHGGEHGTGVGGNIAGKNGDLIVAYGKNAVYLKKTYASGTVNDLMTVVSETW